MNLVTGGKFRKVIGKVAFLLFIFSFFSLAGTADGANIIAFGDSITAGQGSDSGGYPPKLGSLLDHNCKPSTVLNTGVGGEQTPQGIGRLDSVLAAFPADLILIMEGTNDVNSGISVETTQFNLKAMVDKCRAAQVTPVLATLTPSDRGSSGMLIPQIWNPMIKALARNKGVKLADQYTAIMPTWWASNVDGIHPNDSGYQTIADTWHRAIGFDDLRDAVLVLQILVGQVPDNVSKLVVDINGDNKIGLVEIICRLQSAAGMK